MNYLDFLPENGDFTEEELWQAIADSMDVDYTDIADGDLVDYL